MSKKQVTRDDIAKLFGGIPKLEDKHKLIREKLNINNLDPTLDGEALVDAVYAAYQQAYQNLVAKQAEKKAVTPVQAATAEPSEEGGESRKEIITGVIMSSKTIEISKLIGDIDNRCGYAERGKSSRTRVNRVIKDLKAAGKVVVENNVVKVV